jgi:NADH-quinone oxidoreductase subunit A
MTTDDMMTDEEKLSAYECGFTPHGLARIPFDIRFYLVGILFIVFDLETCYMFPWVMTLGEQSAWGYWTIVDFMVELLVGYMYAWKIGALEWE